MAQGGALRLFAAVDLPPTAERAAERAIEAWRVRLSGGMWVPSERWHVTVKFLGRTPTDVLEDVRGACAAAASRIRPFRVGLDGLGVFPSPGRARVLWIGLRDREGGLPALARAVDDELANLFPPETRPFSPHLTVARFKPFTDMRAVIEELRSTRVEASPFRVGKLVLYRSHLSPKGARYEPVGTFALSG
ncbi:MAG TPA: RNA 2',3'-cyclic phosphodiesterase [Actinomycetota bacterium]|nr:RNA 2',3'-cyclic phosphodiesterase [Actinomycetota bacterium]